LAGFSEAELNSVCATVALAVGVDAGNGTVVVSVVIVVSVGAALAAAALTDTGVTAGAAVAAGAVAGAGGSSERFLRADAARSCLLPDSFRISVTGRACTSGAFTAETVAAAARGAGGEAAALFADGTPVDERLARPAAESPTESGSADANAAPERTPAPSPSATAKPPTRPTYVEAPTAPPNCHRQTSGKLRQTLPSR
jgi:hypothetical protein